MRCDAASDPVTCCPQKEKRTNFVCSMSASISVPATPTSATGAGTASAPSTPKPKPIPSKVVCVCTGNTCRSPLLMCFVAAELSKRGFSSVEVVSNGVGAKIGQPATDHAITIIDELKTVQTLKTHKSRHFIEWYETTLKAAGWTGAGTPTHAHTASPLSPLNASVYYLVMTTGHRDALTKLGIGYNQITVVNASSGGIPDPFGQSLDVYRKSAAVMQQFAKEFAAQWTAPAASDSTATATAAAPAS